MPPKRTALPDSETFREMVSKISPKAQARLLDFFENLARQEGIHFCECCPRVAVYVYGGTLLLCEECSHGFDKANLLPIKQRENAQENGQDNQRP